MVESDRGVCSGGVFSDLTPAPDYAGPRFIGQGVQAGDSLIINSRKYPAANGSYLILGVIDEKNLNIGACPVASRSRAVR